MTLTRWFVRLLVLASLLVLSPFAKTALAQTAEKTLPSETPAKLVPVYSGFDYEKREVMIPMRDGVKLHTVILVPQGAKGAPILLTRTPYNASEQASRSNSSHLGPSLYGYDNVTDVIVEDGYIRVIQDIRGKYGSEGDYVMTRPLHGPMNPTPVDHSTDTYDTIDWLVKNIPRDEWQGWNPGDFVRRLFAVDGAGKSSPCPKSRRANESHGRRVEGRRLVSQWRIPPAEYAVHLRTRSHSQQ